MKIEDSAGKVRAALAVLLLAALVVRLGWGLSRPASDATLAALPDQVEYLTLARNVLHGQGLSFVDPRFADRVYAFRMPGYPLFVAACGGNVRVVRVAQAMLDTLTVLGVFLMARALMLGAGSAGLLNRGKNPHPNPLPEYQEKGRVGLRGKAGSVGEWPAFIAAGLVAVNPLLVYFTGLILSETLFVAMLTWGMVLLIVGFGSGARAGRPIIWVGGGLLIALSVLVRPSAALLPVLMGFAALFANRVKGAAYQSSLVGRWPLPVGTTMLLLVGLVLVPWMVRNYQLLHNSIWADTNSGFTLYDGYNPDATGASDQRFVREMPQLRLMNEVVRSQYLTLRATEFIKQHRRRVLELALVKAARTWSPMPLSDQFGNPGYKAVLLLYSLPLDLLALWGIWQGNLRRSAKVFLLLPAIYLTVVHALTIGSLRYRVPAEPALAVLAASVFIGNRIDGADKS